MDLLYLPIQELATEQRLTHVDRVLVLLQKSTQHATFAAQSPDRLDREQDFVRFLGLMAHNVQSAHAMMQHQAHLEEEEGFLCHFLSATAEECALPALHYRRRADDSRALPYQELCLRHQMRRDAHLPRRRLSRRGATERRRARTAPAWCG